MKELYIYEVSPSYLRFLHKVDHRVSVKFNNRPFVGVITMINGMEYLHTFESNEIRFIRKHKNDIISKARKVYEDRIKQEDSFLNRICCDFKLLEKYHQKYLVQIQKNLD